MVRQNPINSYKFTYEIYIRVVFLSLVFTKTYNYYFLQLISFKIYARIFSIYFSAMVYLNFTNQCECNFKALLLNIIY